VTVEQGAAAFHALARECERGAEAVVANTLDDLLATAHRNSEGPLTPAELRGLDFPYARRHGASGLTLGIINRQSGDFDAAWEEDGPTEADGGWEAFIFNTSDHARYLFDPDASDFPDGGTKRMLGRDLPALVTAEVEPRFRQRVAHLIDLLT
jgi:hypothetical protein